MFAISCKEELPDNNCCTCTAPFTETGAGTMSFDLNGTTWSPCNTIDKNGTSPLMSTQRNPNSGFLLLKGQSLFKQGEETVYIQLWYPQKGLVTHASPDIGNISRGQISIEFFANNLNLNQNGIYYSDKNLPFNLEITKLDTINKIISGTFACSMYLTGSSIQDTIQVKNGHFDTRYL